MSISYPHPYKSFVMSRSSPWYNAPVVDIGLDFAVLGVTPSQYDESLMVMQSYQDSKTSSSSSSSYQGRVGDSAKPMNPKPRASRPTFDAALGNVNHIGRGSMYMAS